MEMISGDSALPPQLEGLISLLSDDERPAFVLRSSKPHQVAYQNASLVSLISDKLSFQQWIATLPDYVFQADEEASVKSAGHFVGRTWLSKRIGYPDYTTFYCSSNNLDHQDAPQHRVQDREQMYSSGRATDYSRDKISTWFFDWFQSSNLTKDDWIQFLIDYDWEHTALGPVQSWPQDLRRLAVYVLSAPDPRLILWGDNQLGLYNAAAKPILGQQYLACLGQPLADGLSPRVAEMNIQSLRRNIENGTFTKEIDMEYILTRYGFEEEAHFSFHIAPVPGDHGYLVGSVIEFNETTSAVIQECKSQVASTLLDNIHNAKDPDALWTGVVNGFITQPKYISYAVVYTKASDIPCEGSYRLRGSAGVDPTEFVDNIDIRDDTQHSALASVFKKAGYSDMVMDLQEKDGTLPKELAIHIAGRGTVNKVSVISIDGDCSKRAFCILGMNPRLNYKYHDRSLIGHLRDVILKSFTAISHPEDHKREQDLETLNKELAKKLRLAKKSEDSFVRMTRNSPFGMYCFDKNGIPIFVNEAWLRLSGFASREEFETAAQSGYYWREKIAPEELDHVKKCWHTALTSKCPTKHEHRLIVPPQEHDDDEEEEEAGPRYRWLEAISFPELDDDGSVAGIKGWLVDINHRKLAEDLMAQRLSDALETKRASERFIDMVSHEIRNPLSAILQLADGILTSALSHNYDAEATVDAAQTIILCAQFQRGIVDDVLLMSKLDSNLLILSPDRCSPTALIQKALKMHESELAKANIKASMMVMQNYKDLELESVSLDEGRVLQVIINLLANAIKFTHGSGTRNIIVYMAARRDVPTGEEYNIKFAKIRADRPRESRSRSNAMIKDDTPREDIYLQFAVKDTGRGLTEGEIERLFRRFSQGSPKTYKKYGGTGLGLYICKELCELQGGQIGVKSDGPGKGATFAFYVKTWRAGPLSTPSSPAASTCVDEVISTQPLDIDSVTTMTVRDTPTHHVKVDSITARTEVEKIETSVTNTRGNGKTENIVTEIKGVKRRTSRTAKDGFHVLVVEDNAINQKVMAQQLRRTGCTVHVANHGVEALDFLITTDFQDGDTPLDVILMDIEMPIMDGLECTKQIRKLQVDEAIKRHVPIIAVTANARDQQIADATKAGVNEVVTKPFRIPELVPRIQALVGKLRED